MKRFLFGFLWFVCFYFGGLMLGAIITDEMSARPTETFSEGNAWGREFGEKYSKHFLVAALVLSVTGSGFGFLPGTRREAAKEKTGV